MRHIYLLLFLLTQMACADAQSNTQNSGTAQNTSSIANYKPHNEGWLVSLDKAYDLSKKTGKPIMANFTGSDWCGWCIKLTAAVFSKPEFKSWAEKNVILLEVDFPRRTQLPQEIQAQNNSLQGAFQVSGFPTVWVFHMDKDKTGNYTVNALGKTGYTPTVDEFTRNVDQMIAAGKTQKKN